jgi:hypothetical protein
MYGDRQAVTRKEPIKMLDKSLEEQQALIVDERLAMVARIIVEQYDGDVEAFVESIRYKVEVNRETAAAAGYGNEAAFRTFEH